MEYLFKIRVRMGQKVCSRKGGKEGGKFVRKETEMEKGISISLIMDWV